MSGTVEIRDASTVFTFEGESGRPLIRGVPIVFNAWSHVMYDPRLGKFRELIAPTAVDRTLTSGDAIPAYWNHNGDYVLGSTGSGSMQLRKTPVGLAMELTPTAEWLTTPQMAAVKRGDVRGMSFAFGVQDGGEEWSDRPDAEGVWLRSITDMRFSEVSIVSKPAYPQTSVSVSQRSLETFQAEIGGTRIAYLELLHKNRVA